MLSYGFDGSSNQSIYNQEKIGSEGTLFATVVIPLCFLEGPKFLWINSNSRSVRSCRPLCLEYTKETKEHVLAFKAEIDDEIEKLEQFVYNLDEEITVSVKFHLICSLIDGKVHSLLTGMNNIICA